MPDDKTETANDVGHADGPALDATPNFGFEIVQVAADHVVLTLDFIEVLAKAVAELNLSRRKTPDWLAAVIYGWIELGGAILDPAGAEIDIYPGIVDDAHGEDGSFKWVSDLKGKAEQPPRRRPRQTLLLRLRLYDAAFKIVGRPLT